MNVRLSFSAVAALALASTAAPAFADDVEVNVGSIKNAGGGAIEYTGDYADFISSTLVDQRTIVTIELDALLGSLGYNALLGVRIDDAGANAYGETSPGADLDYLAFTGLSAGNTIGMSYVGPNPTHQDESSGTLGTRTALPDAASGDQDYSQLHFVSLGQAGQLSAMLDAVQPLQSGPLGTGGELISMHLSEHGFGEEIEITAIASTVPAPGALALLGLAGLRRSRRRRR